MWYHPEKNIKATTHSEIRSAFPQVSLPAQMTDENIAGLGFVPFELPADEKAALDAKNISMQAQADLAALDLKSIRSLREYIAAKPDAPAFVKQHEADALALRTKLK